MPYKSPSREKEYHAQYNRAWYRSNKANVLKRTRDYRFRQVYGLSAEEIDQLIVDRGGLCDICHLPAGSGQKLNVDHNHEPPYNIRGMLCPDCNKSLGLMKDSPDRLRAAANYLERTCDYSIGRPSVMSGLSQ